MSKQAKPSKKKHPVLVCNSVMRVFFLHLGERKTAPSMMLLLMAMIARISRMLLMEMMTNMRKI